MDKYIEDLNIPFVNKEGLYVSDFFNCYKEKEGSIPAKRNDGFVNIINFTYHY